MKTFVFTGDIPDITNKSANGLKPFLLSGSAISESNQSVAEDEIRSGLERQGFVQHATKYEKRLGGLKREWGGSCGPRGLPFAFSGDLPVSGIQHYFAIGHITAARVSMYTYPDFTLLPAPAQAPATVQWVAFSPDSKLFAVVSTLTPFVTIYNTQTTPWTKLANPPVLPPRTGDGIGFSADNQWLAVATDANAGETAITIYNTTTWAKKTPDLGRPTGNANACGFSPCGRFFALVGDSYPYSKIYDIRGEPWVAFPNTPHESGSATQGLAWGPDGNTIVFNSLGAPYLSIWNFDGSVWTRREQPANPPTSANVTAPGAISPDGLYYAVGQSSGAMYALYSLPTWTRVTLSGGNPPGGRGAAFSHDSKTLAFVHAGGQGVTLYDMQTLTKLPALSPNPTTNGLGVAFV